MIFHVSGENILTPHVTKKITHPEHCVCTTLCVVVDLILMVMVRIMPTPRMSHLKSHGEPKWNIHLSPQKIMGPLWPK